MNNLENKLKEVMKKTIDLAIPIEQVSTDSQLLLIGINSFLFIRLVVVIENEFGFEFDDECLDYNKFKTLSDLIIYVEEKLNNNYI